MDNEMNWNTKFAKSANGRWQSGEAWGRLPA